MSNRQRPGWRGFLPMWLGQTVSLLGSAMTGFGISIWLFDQTNQASSLTWAMAAFMAPVIFLSPIAGTIVDRSNRKAVLILTDAVAAVTTVVMLALLLTGQLAVWHIYILNFVNGAFNSLQFPAFSAAVTMMVDKKDYARTSGLMQLGGPAANILAPALAAALLGPIGLAGLLVIDLVTFLFAVGAVAIVTIPSPPVSADTPQGSFWADTALGFTYIWRRPSLLGLQLVFMGLNFVSMFSFALLVPLILARSDNNELVLGSVQAIASVGGVAGGLLLGIWGGTRKKVHGVLGGMILGSAATIGFGLARSLIGWAAAGFLLQFFLPFINGSNQAIWQSKVAPDVQGRVFAVRRLIAQVMAPLSAAIAGPLADNVFEPAFRDGALAALVGRGPGAGMAVMFLISGALGVLIAAAGYLSRAVRDAEAILPDHEVAAQTASA